MVVASSDLKVLASTAVVGCWIDAALGSDLECVGEDATCCCRD